MNRPKFAGTEPFNLHALNEGPSHTDFEGGHFDFLAGAIFTEEHSVMRAAIIPSAVVASGATFVERTNSHRFILRDNVWNAADVRDVTAAQCVVEI